MSFFIQENLQFDIKIIQIGQLYQILLRILIL